MSESGEKNESASRFFRIFGFFFGFLARVYCCDRFSIIKISFLRRIRNQHPWKPRNPFFIDLCIVKNRKTVKNQSRRRFLRSRIQLFWPVSNNRIWRNTMHGNIQKLRALMIQQKSDFFLFFSKSVKKINLKKAVKKISMYWFFLQTDF